MLRMQRRLRSPVTLSLAMATASLQIPFCSLSCSFRDAVSAHACSAAPRSSDKAARRTGDRCTAASCQPSVLGALAMACAATAAPALFASARPHSLAFCVWSSCDCRSFGDSAKLFSRGLGGVEGIDSAMTPVLWLTCRARSRGKPLLGEGLYVAPSPRKVSEAALGLAGASCCADLAAVALSNNDSLGCDWTASGGSPTEADDACCQLP